MATNDSVQDLTHERYKAWRIKIDDTTSSTITYIGKAEPGTATSADDWQIFILDESSGLDKKYPNASDAFSFIWDSRTGYTYS